MAFKNKSLVGFVNATSMDDLLKKTEAKAKAQSTMNLYNDVMDLYNRSGEEQLRIQNERRQQQKTAYQQNVSSPVAQEWSVGMTPSTYGQALANVHNLLRTNPAAAKDAYTQLYMLRSQPGSQYYDNYARTTNKAVSNLNDLGFDTSVLNSEWFDNNYDWQNYLIYNGTTNTPSKPGKKASWEENVAYELFQYQKANKDTDAMNKEWAALQQELSYWANRKDLNLSDDEIIGKINWKNYKTLENIDATRTSAQPMELNTPVTYSQEAMRGAIWAARNGGSTGNSDMDIANYYLKSGNTYKANADVRAKRDITNKDTFSYSAGMMGDDLNDAGLYFDRATFDQQWIDDNRGILAGNDATAIKNYKAVVKAEQNTQQAESEAAQLKEALDKKLARYAGQKDGLDKAMAWLDSALKSGDYKMLQKMDSSIDSGIDIVSTTRGVDYAGRDMKKYVQDFFDALPQQSTGNDVVTSATSGVPTVTGAMQNRGQNIMHSDPSARSNVIFNGDGTVTIDDHGAVDYSLTVIPEDPRVQDPGAVMENLPVARTGDDLIKEYVKSRRASAVQKDATKSANDADDALNAKVMGTYDAIEPQMTDGEQRYINNVPGVEYGRVFTQLKENMQNMMNMLASGSAKGLADKALTSAEDNYRKTALDSAANRKRFEALQAERDKLYKEVSDAESAPDLGNQVSRTINGVEVAFEKDRNGQYTMIGNPANIEKAGVSKEDWQKEQRKLNMQSSYSHAAEIASIDMPENIQMDIDDGTHEGARLYFVFDPEEGEYVRDEMNMSTGSFYQGKPGGIPESVYGPYLDRINEQYRDVVAAREIVGDLTDEQRQSLSELTEKQAQLDQLEREYSAGLDEYNQQMNALNAAEKRYGIAGRLSHITGGRAADRAADDTMINFVSNLMDFETPEATATSVAEYMDQQRKEYQIQHSSENASARMVKEANEYIAQNNEAIKDAQYVLQQLGSAAEGNDAGVQRYIQYLEKQNSDLADFVFSQSEGFADLAADGRRIAQWETYGGTAEEQTLAFQVMDDYEKDLYYAHLAQDGAEGASAYFQRIDGTLLARAQGNIQSNAEERVQSGIGGRILNELAGIGISSLSVISSLGYVGDSIISGKSGSKWWQLPSLVSRTTHSEDIKAIRETYGDGIKGQIIEGVYDILYNRGRSAMVATTFGGLFPKGTSEIFQAMPIAATAMADSMEKAFDSNASLAQALGIGAATFLAESVTEGIELKNIKNAFGVGKNLTGNVVKEFLRDYIPNALPEVVGESLNDIIENAADRFIMGDKGEHAAAVQSYIDNGYSPDDAEAMATRDELGGVLHTALISFFSPGADIVAVGAGALQSHLYYANQARSINNLTGANFSARDLRLAAERQHRQMVEAQDAAAVTFGRNAAQTQQNPQNTAQTQQEESALTAEAPAAPQASATDADIATLENARGANQTAVAASIASVLATDAPGSEHAAMAAASFFREQDIDTIEQVLDGAQESGINPNTVKTGIQYAAMSADSASFAVMASAEFEQADSQGKARMISEALVQDLNNPDIRKQVTDTIHQARVAEQEKALMANANESIMGEQQKVTDAQNAAQNAQSDLDTANKNLSDAQEALTAANHEYQESLNDPTADNAQSHNEKVVNEALNKVTNAVSETNAAQGRLDQAQANLQQVQSKADQVINDQRIAIHDQAEQIVAEQEAAEAQARQEAEAVAAEENRVNQETSNVANLSAEDFITQAFPTATPEEREYVRQRMQEMYRSRNQTLAAQQQPVQPGMANPEDIARRDDFARRLSSKFGVNIRIADTTEGGAKERQNGFWNPNTNTITLDSSATQRDIVVHTLIHELTHTAQQSETYGALADALLKLRYGNDVGSLAELAALAEKGDLANKAVSDIYHRMQRYNRFLSQVGESPIDGTGAAQEVVADIMGDLLQGDQSLVDRFVDNEPSVARRIMEAIKSFLKKMVGIEDESIDQARHLVDMLDASLRLRTLQQTQQGQNIQHSLEAQPIVQNNNGDTLVDELPGGTVSNVQYSLRTWTDEEQEKVKDQLVNSGRFTESDVTKWINDVNGIASVIAADRARLDFDVNKDEAGNNVHRFLKPNQDYEYTLDASTLCAKRLLYQGTFNAVQHMMPDTPFMPEDLIDLVNIMREMGYETPCGICYVESRRRWLDTYAQDWLDKFKGENKPTIDQLTTSDGLEELRRNDFATYQKFVKAMNAKGSANPKVVQLRTEYAGDIRSLTKKDIQKVKDIGGLRVQSFSDFETPHLLDMVQAVYDMASVGLTSQAYTKVPNFAWVFGDTGIKINLSLIGKGKGVDENGELVFDNTEGMNFNDAMKIRERYGENVGTILVGINDEHIIAAMGDPRIDFIIPFHKSGWSQEELRKVGTLNGYADFTDFQNERVILGREETEMTFSEKAKASGEVEKWIRNQRGSGKTTFTIKEENGKTVVHASGYKIESFTSEGKRLGIPESEQRKNFEPVGKNQYWNFDESGEWNAMHYLEMCAKDGRMPKFWKYLVDNGDGSFSLPEGTDKQSTAIREGYWKTLTDFKMYENDSYGRTVQNEDGTTTRTVVKGAPQREVTPNINMTEAYRVLDQYKLGRQMPDRPDGTKGPFVPMESNNSLPVAMPAAELFVEHMKAKQARREAEAQSDVIEVKPLTKAQRALREEQINLQMLNARLATAGYAGDLTLGNTQSEATEYEPQARNAMAIDPETGNSVRVSYSLPVTDEETLSFLNDQEEKGEVTTTYRTMKLLDGKLVSPKASLINGKVEGDTQLGQWEEAVEHPELIQFDENGKPYFELEEKGRKTRARYNPYMHSSNLMLNDQFTGAYQYSGNDKKLGKFVTVECIVPNSEAASGYQAQYAKDPVGWTDWKSGGVAQEVERQGGEARRVFLSRWIKPIRIVSDQEVAQHYKKVLGDRDIEIPANVVTPGLLSELEKVGVKIGAPTSQQAKKYRKMMGNKYSLPSDAPYLSAVERGEMDDAQQMVDEAAREAGYTTKAYTSDDYVQNNNRYSLSDVDAEYDEALAEGNEDWQKQIAVGAAYDNGYTTGAYHGSPNTDITEFNTRSNESNKQKLQLLFGTHFTQNRSFAEIYAKKAKNSKGTSRMTSHFGKVYDVALDLGKSLDLRTAANYTPDTEMYHLYSDLPANIRKKHKPYTFSAYDTEMGLGSGEFITARQIEESLQDMSPKDATEFLVSHGYNSVLYNANYNVGMANNAFGRDPSIIMLDPERIKSTDPVTYDDQGNVIPLSERFNRGSKDIRYSLPSQDELDARIMEYLANGGMVQEDPTVNLEGRNPAATTAGGEAQRAFGQGMLQDNDEMDAFVKRYVANQNGYTPDSNGAQIDRAIQWIRGNKASSTSDGLYESLEKVTSNHFDYRSADGQARMVALMGMAAYKNDVMAQVSLADAFNRQGTDLGRALQARKLFRLMTPEGRIGTLRRMMEQTQQETGNEDLKFSEWIYRAAAAAETEDDFKKVQKAAAKELAEQLPVSWKDRLQAIRMLSMLANPRTHVRNIIGNSVFIPAVGLKNKLAAVMELGMDQGQRTKTLSPILSRDAREFARRDALAMKDVLTGEAKYNEDNAVKREQKPFKGVLQMLMDFNSNALEGEDWFFLKGHYRRALGSWMMANGYSSAQLEANPQLLEAGRAYAVEEAQKATYRDFSQIASTLNQVSRKGGVAGFVVDAALPFKKTPANILKRGLEYSPFGIAKALTADAKHLHDYLKYQSGKTKIMPEDAITPTQFIDHLCAGLSGTAIMAIGALLGHMGMASCGLDDDDDKLQTMQGEQPYALNIRNIVNGIAGFELMGENVTYTVDWAAPMSMPFFVGVAIMEQLERERGDFDIGEMINAAGAIAEPVFNLSMLDGVNSLFETSQYDDTNTITQIGAKIATNYLSSYVPSVVGAVTRSFVDPIRRKAYVRSGEGTGIMGTARYAWEQFENKIPGLSESNIPYRDAWGEYKDEGVLKKAFENFLSPGYLSITEEDGVVDELARLYESTGDAKMIPEMPGKKIKDMALSAEQYDQLTVERGQMAKSLLTDLMTTGYYQNAADEDKASMVRDVWTYANQNANHSINEDVKLDSWVLNSRSNPVQGIINRSASTIGKETANGYVNAGVEAVQKGDWDSLDVCLEKLAELKAEGITPGKTIRAKVTEIYKPEYVRAYQDDDYARMEEIEETLTDSELGYKESDFTKWINATDAQVSSDNDYSDSGDTTGRYGRGNIDLNNRQVVQNADGSISTERSFSVEIDGQEVLLPTVINGRIVSEDEAIDHYYQTGEYLGKFDTPEEADEYADMLHNRQNWYYNR